MTMSVVLAKMTLCYRQRRCKAEVSAVDLLPESLASGSCCEIVANCLRDFVGWLDMGVDAG